VTVVVRGVEEHLSTLAEGGLESPSLYIEQPGHALILQGWALGRQSPVTRIEIRWEETEVLASADVSEPRPDVGGAHEGLSWAAKSGFRFGLNVLGLPTRQCHLTVVAVLEDGSTAHLWTLVVHRDVVAPAESQSLEPVLVTTLGRTGSTLLMTLLAQHPEMVVYDTILGEARILTYWLRVVETLTDPMNYIRSLQPLDLDKASWWMDGGGAPLPYVATDSLDDWLRLGQVEQICSFARRQVDAFYTNTAQQPPRPSGRFFAEKFLPDPALARIVAELYPNRREVILVRDFRDMMCSIIAMDRQRGYYGFGRQRGEKMQTFIARTAASAALLQDAARDRADTAFVVQYEDLALHQSDTLRSLLAYLGLAREPEIINGMIEGANQLDTSEHRTSASVEESIGRWKTDLSPEEQEACELAFGDSLTAFGYSWTK
jgi:Sulfotransferase family